MRCRAPATELNIRTLRSHPRVQKDQRLPLLASFHATGPPLATICLNAENQVLVAVRLVPETRFSWKLDV